MFSVILHNFLKIKNNLELYYITENIYVTNIGFCDIMLFADIQFCIY